MSESPEEQQAAAVRALAAAARSRAEALAAADRATDRVRAAVLAARRAGVTVRRAAEVGGVAPDTVNRWTKEAAAADTEHEGDDHDR